MNGLKGLKFNELAAIPQFMPIIRSQSPPRIAKQELWKTYKSWE